MKISGLQVVQIKMEYPEQNVNIDIAEVGFI